MSIPTARKPLFPNVIFRLARRPRFMQYGATSMERPFSLYADLRVPPDAPPAAIESAYRRLMKLYHPDHAGPEAAGQAAEINAAYSVLRNPERRAAYDRREHARQHTFHAAEMERLVRRRRIVRGSSWFAAAIALGAGIPLGANWYNGGIVPQRTAAVKTPAAVDRPIEVDERDPAEHVADFLAKAAIDRPVLHAPASTKPAEIRPASHPRAAAAAVAADAPVRMQRAAPRQSPRRTQREPAETDFLEREGFIY